MRLVDRVDMAVIECYWSGRVISDYALETRLDSGNVGKELASSVRLLMDEC